MRIVAILNTAHSYVGGSISWNVSVKYPEFVDNSQFYALHDSLSAERQLVAMTENVKQIHALASAKYDSFEALIHAYIDAGLNIFAMETGIVSKIVGDVYTVKDVVSPLEVLAVGAEFALDDTYCREVFQTRQVVCFPHVGQHADMCAHPVYESLQLEAYVSAPIWVDGEVYGTVNFTSRQPRQYGFSEHEKDLIEMMAKAIGHFIVLQRREDRLRELNDRLKELVGYVSHDLRNPLGIIKTMASMGAKRASDDERTATLFERISASSDSCLELVTAILDVAALGSGKLTLHQAPVCVNSVIDTALANCQHLLEQKSLSVDVQVSGALQYVADAQRLQQVFVNLLTNAAKYGESHSTISVVVKGADKNDGLLTSIYNTIAQQNHGPTYSLETDIPSIGFGLDIVREILQAHGSELICQPTHHQFTACFVLPSA